jgi:hypothetical protein
LNVGARELVRLLLLGVSIVIALLAGMGIGYYSQLGNITTSTVIATYTATTTITITESPFDAVHEVQLACAYLESNYNASLGLVSETPSHERFFLNSDNYLASLVLSRECGNPGLAERINQTLARYNAQNFPNQFMVFSCREDFNGSTNYNLSGKIWTTINNQPGGPLKDGYADIAFLQAYYEKMCAGNAPGALAAFNAGAAEYNGIGFNDSAFREGPSHGIYQTYKLALYIYVSELLGQLVPLSALTSLLQMQASDGGFYTGYYPGLTHGNTTTNTETTSLTILALSI